MENLTRRSILLSLSTAAMTAPFLSLQEAFAAGDAGPLVFIGVYTDQGSKSLGIYSYRWNAAKGELTALGLAAATPNPSFLAVSKDRRSLYAVNEVNDFQGAKDGSVSSFAIDSATGKLQGRNVLSSGGSGPCQISLDHRNESVYVADYDGGSLATYTLGAGGKLNGPVADIHYPGHGPNPDRQKTAHAHTATLSPDNRFLLVNDLGLDKIHIYKLNAATAEITPNDPPAYEAMPGSGPRSFAFHPNGQFAYSTNEIVNSVDALHWDAAKGVLTRVQNISSLPEGFHAPATGPLANTLASVNVSADGRFVHVSNRGTENSIVTFSVDAGSGKLTFVQRIPSGGKTPRHFAIDPSGKWIVVAHQDSHTLVVFARDEASGRLSATGRVYPIDWPTCVLFA